MGKKRETFADILSAVPPPLGPAPDDHTAFDAAEFKDGHRSMILVEESC